MKRQRAGFRVGANAAICFAGPGAGFSSRSSHCCQTQHCAIRGTAGINTENAMSNQEWWAAERKAAEFWRRVKENQRDSHGGDSLNRGRGAAPFARPLVSVVRLLSQTGLGQPLK